MFLFLFTSFVALVLGCVIYWNVTLYFNYRKLKHLKGVSQYFFMPFRVPIIAPYVYFGGSKQLNETMNRFGDEETKTLRVSAVNGNSVQFCDPKLLKEIYVTKAGHFNKPEIAYTMFNVFGENILSALETETWKKHHKICAPAFSSKSLEYMCKVSSDAIDLLMETRWTKDKAFNLDLGDFSDATLDVLGKAGFGIDFSIFSEDEDGKKFRTALEQVITKGIIINRFLGSFPIVKKYVSQWTGVEQAVTTISSKLDQIIDQKESDYLTNDCESSDLLSNLVGANAQEQDLLSREELKSNAFIFAAAGHETTSTTLQWTAYELGKHPEIQQKAIEEVDTLLGKRAPTYADFPNMHYIHSIILECLRKNPPVSAIVKQVKKDVTVGKFFLPKDTRVITNIYSTNLNDKVWEEPLAFKPERFMQDRHKIQQDFTFVPFSMGLRKCIGYNFAQMEAVMMVARILQSYEFKLLNDESKKEDTVYPIPGITQRPGNLRVQLVPRSN
ncbi:hypothetical protein ABK040_002401 [Willaertia magna]